jgi:hypothetical protein
MMNAMKTQNMKAGVMGGARRCLVQVARKFQSNSDACALGLSVFTMQGPRHRGGVNTTVHSSHQLPGRALVFSEAAESIGKSPAAIDRLTERGFRNKTRNDSETLQSIQPQGQSVAITPFFCPKPQNPRPVKGRMVRRCNKRKNLFGRSGAARAQSSFSRR